MTTILEQLEDLSKKMKSGEINETTMNRFIILSIQEIISTQNVRSGDDLVKLPKANLVSMIDAIAFLTYYPTWVPQSNEIDVEVVDTDEA